MGYKVPADLPKLSSSYLKENGGAWLLRLYKDSPAKMFSTLYPELLILEEPWRFPEITQRSWSRDPAMVRGFLDWVATKMGVHKPMDWLEKSSSDLSQYGGKNIVRHSKGSWSAILRKAYPEFEWPDDSDTESIDDVRRIIDAAMKNLGLELHDMYEIQLSQLYGDSKLQNILRYRFNSSISNALVTAFPEHAWDISRFKELPSDPAKRLSLLMRFVKDTLTPSLHIGKLEDWYRVSKHDIHRLCHRRFKEFESQASMCDLLCQIYPDHAWDTHAFVASGISGSKAIPRRRTTQRLLLSTIQSVRFALA